LAFVPPIVNLAYGGINVTGIGQAALYLLLALLVGFNEEVFFRGLMLKPLAQRGPWRAAIITAILFGITHSLNVLAGSNPGYVALQIGYALAIGFGYAAMALTAGTIWPLILAHFLTNLFGFLAGGPGGSTVTTVEYVIAAVYIVAFIAWGVYLLLKLRRRPAAYSN
jgi:membrane protease YdiL (CAAX protease family)